MEELRNYQKMIVDKILRVPKVAIWAEMGLGKTRCVIEALKMLGRPLTLVVAPKMVAETTWEQEYKKWDRDARVVVIKGNAKQREMLAEMPADVYVLSRDNVDWFWQTFALKKIFDCIVLDEASSFKSYSSKRFKAIKNYTEFCKRVIELTGTPASNGYIDLWSQIFLLDRGKRLGRYITHYREKFFTGPIVNGYRIYNKPLHGAVEYINNLLRDITFSMKAADNLKLPDRIDNKIEMKMDGRLTRTYNKMKKDYILGFDITASNAAVLTGKLSQLANGFVYNDKKEVVDFSKHKIDFLKEIIDTATDNILIYAIFQRDIAEIEKLGAVKIDSPQKIIDWQNGKIKVAVAQPQSIGMGTNLQSGGHIIIWYSLPWSLEIYQQANARLYRQGQEFPVTINHIIMKDTIEEQIMEALKNKNITQEILLNACKIHTTKSSTNVAF